VRTLKLNDNVEEILRSLVIRQNSKFKILKSATRWYYKDYRTAPIEFTDGGNASGDESSDDEEDMTLSDLAYIRQAEKRGYLYRRSSKDNNLWRKRLCILTDKIWCVDTRRKEPRALCIKLSGNSRVHDQLPGVNCPNAIAINCNQGMFLFRAASTQEQQSWIDELHLRAMLTADNDAINMAEMIICDEEFTRCQKAQRAVSDMLSNSIFRNAMASIGDDLASAGDGIIQRPFRGFRASSRSARSNLDALASTDELLSSSVLGKSSDSLSNLQSNSGTASRRMSSKAEEGEDEEVVEFPSSSNAHLDVGLSQQTRLTVRCSIFPRRNESLLHQLHSEDGLSFGLCGVSGILAFASAVQLFKEKFRHDVILSPKRQWLSAVTVYQDHIEPHLIRQGHIIKSIGSDGSIELIFVDTLSSDNDSPLGSSGTDAAVVVGVTSADSGSVRTPDRGSRDISSPSGKHQSSATLATPVSDTFSPPASRAMYGAGNDSDVRSRRPSSNRENVWDSVEMSLVKVYRDIFSNIRPALPREKNARKISSRGPKGDDATATAVAGSGDLSTAKVLNNHSLPGSIDSNEISRSRSLSPTVGDAANRGFSSSSSQSSSGDGGDGGRVLSSDTNDSSSAERTTEGGHEELEDEHDEHDDDDTTNGNSAPANAFWSWARQMSANTNNMFASLQNMVGGQPAPASANDVDADNLVTGDNKRTAYRLVDPELRPEPELFDGLLAELLDIIDRIQKNSPSSDTGCLEL
jgi:hypothetical protein